MRVVWQNSIRISSKNFLFTFVGFLALMRNIQQMKRNFLKPYTQEVQTAIKPEKPKPVKKPKRGEEQSAFGAIVLMLFKMSGIGMVLASGKLGGTVINSGGQQGQFARVLAIPKNRRTSLQVLARGIFSGISSAWKALTAAQVTAWNSSAADDAATSLRRNVFGDVRNLSGNQLFQRVNNILQALGIAPYSSPPTVGTTDAITSVTAAADASSVSFGLAITTFGAATTVPANTSVEFYASAQKGTGRSYFGKSQLRLVGTYPATTAINPLDVVADYTAQFGALIAGSKIGYEVRFIYNNAGVFAIGGAVGGVVTVVP